jgi:glycine hydroxymethyltransferase
MTQWQNTPQEHNGVMHNAYQTHHTMIDTHMAQYIAAESKRQQDHIELIASENFVSRDILMAAGSILTNKYAEGYPGKRYYGGCEHVDQVEQLAIERAKSLFGCAFANVQPHSGSQANQAVFLALLKPGDGILGMSMDAGGHLTHGAPVSLTGKWFNIVSYGVNPISHRVDMDQVRDLAKKHRPKLMIVGASSYPRVLNFKEFRDIADEVGAFLLADVAHISGLIVTGHHPHPFPYAHVVTSTTHKTLRGPRGGIVLTNDEDLAKKINTAVFPGLQGGPLMHVIAAKGIAFQEASTQAFSNYIGAVCDNAVALAAALSDLGYALVSGGTDNHLLVMDFSGSDLSGQTAQHALESVRITTNKNGVPNDQRSYVQTSGLRLGTPAITTRGFMVSDMEIIAQCIHQRLGNLDGPVDDLVKQVEQLCQKYPLN